jgi:hypothetical protein
MPRLEEFGYSDFFNKSREALNLSLSSLARITSCHKDTYEAAGENGEYSAKIAGKLKFFL